MMNKFSHHRHVRVVGISATTKVQRKEWRPTHRKANKNNSVMQLASRVSNQRQNDRNNTMASTQGGLRDGPWPWPPCEMEGVAPHSIWRPDYSLVTRLADGALASATRLQHCAWWTWWPGPVLPPHLRRCRAPAHASDVPRCALSANMYDMEVWLRAYDNVHIEVVSAAQRRAVPYK